MSSTLKALLILGVPALIIIGLSIRHKGATSVVSHQAHPQTSSVGPHEPRLSIDSVLQHGHIVEIKGATEPDATVLINGKKVAVIFEGSTFKHFVGPLSSGETLLTITAQNLNGGVATKQVWISIP
ncbi:MAG: hypothetical protein NVS1B11_09040 [Terriglobales bacterium]